MIGQGRAARVIVKLVFVTRAVVSKVFVSEIIEGHQLNILPKEAILSRPMCPRWKFRSIV